MKNQCFRFFLLAALAGLLVTAAATAQEVKFEDPTGDDNGPGEYVYPTDAVYTSGSFDLTELKLSAKGKKANVEVKVNANLEDPWGMGVGFATQMIFVFIDTDGEEGSGFTAGLPGLNVEFAASDAWDKCIVLSPQAKSKVSQEIEAKAGEMASAVIVPSRTTGRGRSIVASVKLDEIGEGDPASWGYQVVVQSNEGFPDDTSILMRKVNEFEGQHRFGGGTDYDCDPHVMDILGDHSQLKYDCEADGTSKQMAVLKMSRL